MIVSGARACGSCCPKYLPYLSLSTVGFKAEQLHREAHSDPTGRKGPFSHRLLGSSQHLKKQALGEQGWACGCVSSPSRVCAAWLGAQSGPATGASICTFWLGFWGWRRPAFTGFPAGLGQKVKVCPWVVS